MSNLHIDRLLQSLTVRPDLGLTTAGRPGDVAPAFDSHFRQAGAPDRPPSSPPQRGALKHDRERAEAERASSADAKRSIAHGASPAAAESPSTAATEPDRHDVAAKDGANADNQQDSRDAADAVASSEALAVAVLDEQAVLGESRPAANSTEQQVDADESANKDAKHSNGIKAAGDGENNSGQNSLTAVVGPDGAADSQDESVDADRGSARNHVQPTRAEAKNGELAESSLEPKRQDATGAPGVDDSEQYDALNADRNVEHGQRGDGRSTHERGDGVQSHGARPGERDRPAATGGVSGDGAKPGIASASPAAAAAPIVEEDRAAVADEDSPAPKKPATTRARTSGTPRIGTVPQAMPASVRATVPETDDSAFGSNATTVASQATKTGDADLSDGVLTAFARFDRSGALGGRSTHRATDGPGAPQVDPARFVSRIARAIHTAHERGGPLQLRLSPPELGSLRMELSVRQGALTASVETDNSTARQLLLDNLPALRDRLAEQNLRIERFDVDVRRDGGGDQPAWGPHHRDQHQPRESTPSGRTVGRSESSGEPVVESPQLTRSSITDTSINVVA